MALSIGVNVSSYPQGEEIAIEGVGRFVNGGPAVEISIAAEEAFFVLNGRPISEMKDQAGFTVTGSSEFTPPVEDETEEPSTVTPVTESGLPQATEPEDDN